MPLGSKGGKFTELSKERSDVLADTTHGSFSTISVSVDGGSTAPTGGGDLLKAGTVLCPQTSGNTGLYKPFNSAGTDGEEDETWAVVLEHDLDLADYSGGEKVRATVYVRAVVKADSLDWNGTFTWGDLKNDLTPVPQPASTT